MKNMFLLISTVISFFSFYSCCIPIPPDPPDPPDTTKAPLTLVWSNNFDNTPKIPDSIFHSNDPVSYENDIIYCKWRTNMDKWIEILRAEGETGIIKWQTELNDTRVLSMDIWQNKILVHCEYLTFCLDAKNGQLIWTLDLKSKDECWGGGIMKILDGYVYLPVGGCMFPQQLYQRLIKIDINTGKEVEVIRFNRNYSSARSPFISPPNKLVNKVGEEILYFTVTWLHILASKIDSSVWYYAYNMTKKEMLWEKKYFEKGTEGNYSPMVWEDKVYFVGWNRVYCFDAFTGEQKWTTYLPEPNDWMGFILTEPFIHNGIIVMKSTTRNIYGIDAKTGNRLWTNLNTQCANVRYIVPYKDKICYDCYVKDKIFMNVLLTGEELFAFDSPFENEGGLFGKDGIAVNEEKGLLYANDGIYFMCFKINVE